MGERLGLRCPWRVGLVVDRHGDCRFGERVFERARVIVPNEVQGEDVVIDDRQPLGMNAGSVHSDRNMDSMFCAWTDRGVGRGKRHRHITVRMDRS